MKTPLLNEQERFILKLNRDGKIYTPTRIAFYELAVACRKFKMPIKKLLKKHIQKLLWFNLILFLLLLVLLLSSCMPTLYERCGKGVVVDKYWNFSNGYFLVIEKDGKMYDYQVSRKEYKEYDEGEVINKD